MTVMSPDPKKGPNHIKVPELILFTIHLRQYVLCHLGQCFVLLDKHSFLSLQQFYLLKSKNIYDNITRVEQHWSVRQQDLIAEKGKLIHFNLPLIFEQ